MVNHFFLTFGKAFCRLPIKFYQLLQEFVSGFQIVSNLMKLLNQLLQTRSHPRNEWLNLPIKIRTNPQWVAFNASTYSSNLLTSDNQFARRALSEGVR